MFSTVHDITVFSGIDLFSVATCKVPEAAIAVKGEDAFFLSVFVIDIVPQSRNVYRTMGRRFVKISMVSV